MSLVIAPAGAERRAFKIHSSIIKTLIHEQSGSLPKGVAELVMNSIDAGATRIDLTVDAKGAFEFVDDGKGFQSRDEIEQFFETFGTPHVDGDAPYGRFRCGRGQIMSYASTVWRSGHFEMRVDLDVGSIESGYDLVEHAEPYAGCRITGQFYNFEVGFQTSGYSLRTYFVGASRDDEGYPVGPGGELGQIVRYAPIPIFVNGQQINTLPVDAQWDHEDEHARYRFERESHELRLYNRGILVNSYPNHRFGIGGAISTKVPLAVNLARNSVLEDRCPVWQAIEPVVRERFAFQLTRVKKLNDNEAAALLRDIYFSTVNLDGTVVKAILKLRFIPDIFGKLVTPYEGLDAQCFTLFDGRHTGIAERVEREGLAKVVMPKLLKIANAAADHDNLPRVLAKLLTKLHLTWDGAPPVKVVPFSHFVEQLNDTASFVDDEELGKEERLVLECLRAINHRVQCAVYPGRDRRAEPRKIVAGISDTKDAWTDGSTFIAVNREALLQIRQCGALWLLCLLVHEYAHPESSAGDHHHDFDFKARFHEAMFQADIGKCVDDMLRYYVQGLAKLGLWPSSHHGKYVRAIADYVPQLPTRKKKAESLTGLE